MLAVGAALYDDEEGRMPAGDTARSKSQLVADIYGLTGRTPEPLGPGSKEKRSVLEALAEMVGLDPDGHPGKVRLASAIADVIHVPWGPTCWSSGDTITTAGFAALLEGARAFGSTAPETPKRDVWGQPATPASWDSSTEGDDRMAYDPADREERNRSEHSVAEIMSSLSHAPDAPSEIRSDLGSPFDPEAVGFADGSWRARLLDVEGWLRLANALDNTSPRRFAESLAAGLGADANAVAEQSEGAVLTDLGLERLRERLDRAQDFQAAFQEILEEDGGTRSAATGEWLSRWEDAETEDENETQETVLAKSNVWPIQSLLGYAQKGRLNLTPPYQRGDVWPTADAQLLMESILRGIPLPSVILLRKQEGDDYMLEVVDGKQRITSILRFVGQHPRAIERVKEASRTYQEPGLLALFQADYPAFRRRWKELTGESLTATKEREYYFPFPLRRGVAPLSGPLKRLEGKYYCEAKDLPVKVANQQGDVSEIFEGPAEYKLAVIEYQQATPRQIHEVFNLYNKQGKHLNAEEIRNALYQNLALMRALLVAAGDIEDVQGAAPFLLDAWDDVSSIARLLKDYDFGTTRFKRAKLLSWVASVLLLEDGTLRSTAGQINALLERVAGDRRDPLRAEDTIARLITLIDKGLDAHAAGEDAWAPQFVNTKQTDKWQELQLVASLVGVIGAGAVLGEELEDRVLERADELYERSSSEWARPKKTQTREQWLFIARTAAGIMDVLGVDPETADVEIRHRFGTSGVQHLVELARREQ